jgi:hypothetical protein
MLDVHPAHHAATTWRDFFIHIATIVLGLLIAIGLEQTVEFFHHRHQRHQLREDLRNEAEAHIKRLQAEEKINAADVAWYRDVLRAGREAAVVDGWVTFTLPLRGSRTGYISVPANGVWSAAKASGSAAVLPAEEIALWDYIDNGTAVTMKSFDSREESLKVAYAFAERKGISTAPGSTLHLSVDDRDELMRAFARLVEDTYILERNDAYRQGAIRGILNGAKTVDELVPYALRAIAEMPK